MSGHNPPQFAPDDPNANSGAYGNHGQREKHPVKPELRTSGGRQSSGKWFGTLGQLDFDIDFFEKLLVRNGSSVEVLRTLAELVSRKGMMQRAVEVDRMLVTDSGLPGPREASTPGPIAMSYERSWAGSG